MRTKIIITCLLILCMASPLQAQSSRSTGSQDDEFLDWAFADGASPFIEVSYGWGSQQHRDFVTDYAAMGVPELKLGYSKIEDFGRKWVKSLDERYLFGSYGDPSLDPFENAKPSEIHTEMVRFGFGNRLGFGYRLGPIGLLPYNQNAFAWTQFKSQTPDSITTSEADVIERYGDQYRFGTLAEAGFKVELFGSFAAVASAEGAVVFPRTVFWEWFASMMIQYGAQGLIARFGEDIVSATPLFGPIIYFILKNGVSFAFYQGMKESMNWPFTSETPITVETLKLGASITF